MKYLRIDGSTTLEDRESAIKRFNDPEGGVRDGGAEGKL